MSFVQSPGTLGQIMKPKRFSNIYVYRELKCEYCAIVTATFVVFLKAFF